MEYIEILKWINYKDLPSFYQDADICVIPSLWPEPFGITAIEAMACGKPVIASRIGGLKNIVDHGENGFLFKPGNCMELAEKIKSLPDADKIELVDSILTQLDKPDPEIDRIWADVPDSEWEKLPADLSDQLDHYIYGLPKE